MISSYNVKKFMTLPPYYSLFHRVVRILFLMVLKMEIRKLVQLEAYLIKFLFGICQCEQHAQAHQNGAAQIATI